MMITKLREAGATDVIQHGDSWFEADTYLRETFIESQGQGGDAATKRNIYVPPFDHPQIWKGVGTMIDEIARQMPPRDVSKGPFPADAVVCSVGGGGLFNGVVEGLGRHLESQNGDAPGGKVRVLAVETEGTDSLALSLRKGTLQPLPAITSLATSLGALQVAPQTLKNAQCPPAGVDVVSVVGSDAKAAQGVIRLADEHQLQVELACGISVEVGGSVRDYMPDLTPDSRIVIVICGGSNVTAEMVAEYRKRLHDGWDSA
jgi:L-serine/L-threonine ammonia-lyase